MDYFDMGASFASSKSRCTYDSALSLIAERARLIKDRFGKEAMEEFELGAASVLQYSSDMYYGEPEIVSENTSVRTILTDDNERNLSYFGGDFTKVGKKYDINGEFIEPNYKVR